MTYHDLPAAFRGNALEARERFPIVWQAPDLHTARQVAGNVQATVLDGGLGDLFTITISQTYTVTVERADT